MEDYSPMVNGNSRQHSFFIRPEDPPAKQAILEAALHCFVRDGIAGTSIRAIADEAGFTNPALFKHFAGKEALALYLFESCYREVTGRVFGSLDSATPFPERLELMLSRILELMDDEIEALIYIQDNLRQFWPDVGKGLRPFSMLGQLEKLLKDGRDTGFVAQDVDVKLQVAAIAGIINQVGREHYFKELPGSAQDKLPVLLKMLTGLLQPTRE